MKKLFFLLSVVFTLNAFGQYERQNIIKTDLFKGHATNTLFIN